VRSSPSAATHLAAASPLAVPPVRPPRPQYGAVHQRTGRALIAEHVAAYGWWCSGDGDLHPVHPSTDLVADHVTAGDATAGYRVVCRAWNTARRSLGLG